MNLTTIDTHRSQPPSPLGRRIRSLRQANGLSQIELAKQLGVHSTHISRIEHNSYIPSVRLVMQLMMLFEVDANYLLMNEDQKLNEVNIKNRICQKIENLSAENLNTMESIVDSLNGRLRLKEISYSNSAPLSTL